MNPFSIITCTLQVCVCCCLGGRGLCVFAACALLFNTVDFKFPSVNISFSFSPKVSVKLHAKYTTDYPDTPPEIQLVDPQRLSPDLVNDLLKQIKQLAKEKLGEVGRHEYQHVHCLILPLIQCIPEKRFFIPVTMSKGICLVHVHVPHKQFDLYVFSKVYVKLCFVL